MDKKAPLIVLVLLVVAGMGYGGFKYHQTKVDQLTAEKDSLEDDKKRLSREKSDLSRELDQVNRDKVTLTNQLSQLNAQIGQVQQERERYENMYRQVQRERDGLLEELTGLREELAASKNKVQAVVYQPKEDDSQKKELTKDEFWADVLRQKAELETQLEDMTSKIRERDVKLNELESNTKGLEMQIADLDRLRGELQAALEFKERTMTILTKDLVKEREARKSVTIEVEKLKTENVALTREHKFLSRIQQDLEQKLRTSLDEKDILDRKVDEIETVLKEKALDIDSLQKQLTRSIASAKDVTPSQAKAVELPPIVVKSDAVASLPTPALEGKVMAVNAQEKFVIVDLGGTNGVKPGDKFKVLKNGKKIAGLTVIETRKDISACDINEASPASPIKEGDLVTFER